MGCGYTGHCQVTPVSFEMIEIDYHLLSDEAIDNLILETLTRQATDYGEKEMDVAHKKRQLMTRLEQGDAVIVYTSEQGHCAIISREEKEKWFSSKPDS